MNSLSAPRQALLACFLFICAFGTPARAATSPQSTPEATLTAFYHWYLEELAKNRDPLTNDRAKIEGYVSKGLIREIDKISKSPDGLEEDYFVCAQDYLEDWASHVAVSDVQIKGKTTSAVVTLGATKESKRRLALNLINDGGGWKITKVTAIDD